MAEVIVLRTDGTEKDILQKGDENIIHLFMASLDTCKTSEPHEIGDILLNDESDKRFALLAKPMLNGKCNTDGLRVCVLKLIKYLLENEIPVKSFLISKYQFSGEKDEISFISILKEFAITYFREVLTEDITVIITDYKESSKSSYSIV